VEEVMNSPDQPKISILIPSYNHGFFIEKTIRSVWEQNYSNLELIIVDDGSIDGSREVLARLQLISPITMIVIEQKNAGICPTLNKALEKSTGTIIGFLASDDMMLPDRLNQEVYQFTKNKKLKVLYSNGQFQTEGKIFGDAHKHIKQYLKRGITATRDHLLITAPGFYIQAMLIRRDFLLSLGGFDDETGSDDWSLNIRIFKTLVSKDEFRFVDRFSFLYRIHKNQMHRGSGFMSPMKRKVVRKFFTIENRAKFVCQNYAKKALGLCLERKFNQARRYISKAFHIAFSHGVPVACLVKFSFELPAYAYRELIRRLKR
jgi:alpha-1,3-rhamnosyltransferase